MQTTRLAYGQVSVAGVVVHRCRANGEIVNLFFKTEFNGVKRTYIPMQAIIRIDEVEKEGASKVSDTKPAEGGGNVASFPFAGMPPGQQSEE